jgi:flavodoxin
MKKNLVVYYSRTGVTKKLALSIANMLDANREEIVDMKKRSGVI